MSVPKHRDVLFKAIDEYIAANGLMTDLEAHHGISFHGKGRLPSGSFAVWDPPPGGWPEPGSPGSDGPESRGKLVLIAHFQPDGSITVEETEHTDKYMRAHKKRSA
jgi:hypothetical protein